MVAFVASVAVGSLSGVAHAEDKFAHRPIVFVHGYGSGPGVWDGMKQDVEKYGYSSDELFSFGYGDYTPGDTSIVTLGEQLAGYVKDKGLVAKSPDGKIDIIAHSMGGLVARAYLRLDSGHRVTTAHLVTYGTPNHGTVTATVACATGIKCDGQVKQMVPGSDFYQWLGSVGDIPGPTNYVTFRSNIGDEPIVVAAGTGLCDGVVFGADKNGDPSGAYAGETSILRGAENFVTRCMEHGDFYHDDWTKKRTLDMIADNDGAHTPKAVQVGCGSLDSFWGRERWVNAYGQACVTTTRASGQSGARDVQTNLSIRGCGYYYYVAAIWEYAGTDKNYNCESKNVKGILWRAGEWGQTTYDGAGVATRTMELYTPMTKAQPGQTVSGDWTYDVHAYNNAPWDVKQAKSSTPGITVGR
ncbi:alpha/beta fold hydrolase [Streptomyces sp. SID3343]|uniref:esterase/lipase family protein n=1 Tax=Streptomyces sp. SID3343 TaxID=2690260 RepID=UPI00136D69A7|nr:alpha/beta fold hydrolase [Streptomyces sp. SID3343]